VNSGSDIGFVGELAALGTACCWVVTSLAFTRAGQRVGSLAVNYVRLFFALPMLCAVTFVLRGQLLPIDASGEAWMWLSLSGVIGFVFGDMCLFRAFILIGPRLSSLIMATAPLMTAVIGYLVLGEALGLAALLGMVLTIAGVAWALADRSATRVGDGGSRGWGVVLALGGALGQALGLVLSKHGMGDFDAFAATQIRVIAAFVGWSLVMILAGKWSSVGKTMRDSIAMRLLAFGAFFGPVVGVGLSLLAVQRTHAGVAASIMSVTPILLIPIMVIVYRERVGVGSVLGTFLAVGGVVVLFLV
tara:strand:- start:111304 stop:112212 length:909 start_codon:yes stop_codon:yes gene_type:complete